MNNESQHAKFSGLYNGISGLVPRLQRLVVSVCNTLKHRTQYLASWC